MDTHCDLRGMRMNVTRRDLLTTFGLFWASRGLAEDRVQFPDGRQFLSGPCASARSRATIAGPDEPGRRMVVRGRVVLPDGKTPAANVIMYVYQTDNTGVYGVGKSGLPRLHAFLRTDAQGRYEYSSIRPAQYPSRNEAAHVHVQFWARDIPPQWNNDLLFTDDPLVRRVDRERSEKLGEFAFVLTSARAGATLQYEQNFRLKLPPDEFEDVILHGLKACQAPTRI